VRACIRMRSKGGRVRVMCVRISFGCFRVAQCLDALNQNVASVSMNPRDKVCLFDCQANS
jgi:hypothetical protein